MRSLLFRALALGTAAVALCSCGGGKGGQVRGRVTCPATVLAPNLDTYRVFRPGGGTGPADIRFGVKLVGVRSTCDADPSGAGVRVNTQLTFQTARNDPDLRQGDFSYFVAVADAQRNILAKQIFSLRANFAPRQKEMRILDEISEKLPLENLSAGNNYAVIVGLQVNQQQLDLNRGHPGTPPAAAATPVPLPPPVMVPPQ